MGTPLYVSLEQARDASDVDARSDLYSVAVILYELLCGQTPFMPKNMAELFIQLASVQPDSLDTLRALPRGLADVVQKGLAKGRVERYQSALEFAVALAPYSDERSELVLRQMSQRGSARPSRSPSGMPSLSPSPTPAPYQTKTGTLITASGNPSARRIKTGTEPVTPPPPPPPHRVTVAPLSRTHALEAEGDSPVLSRRSRIWALGALLLFVAGSAALAARNRESASVAPPPAESAHSTSVGGASEPARVSAAPQPVELAPAASAVSQALVPSAAFGTRLEPTAERAELAPSPPPSANTAGVGAHRPPEPQRPSAPPPSHRPELKQIEIER
jgi:serine/threonine-protein kinase